MIHRNWQKTYAFQSENHPLNHIFSTVAFVLNLLAILISDTRVFYFQVRISTKLLLNTVEQKSAYVFLPNSFIFWILWKRRHVKALLIYSISKKHVIFEIQNWCESVLSFASLPLRFMTHSLTWRISVRISLVIISQSDFFLQSAQNNSKICFETIFYIFWYFSSNFLKPLAK